MAIITNREYLTAALNRFGMTENDIDVIIVENPILEGVTLDVKACKLAMYNSLSSILPVANVSEGGFSVTWNIDGLKIWYKSLCNELGLVNVMRPTVRNRSNMW